MGLCLPTTDWSGVALPVDTAIDRVGIFIIAGNRLHDIEENAFQVTTVRNGVTILIDFRSVKHLGLYLGTTFAMAKQKITVYKIWMALAVLSILLFAMLTGTNQGRTLLRNVYLKAKGKYTVADRVAQFGARVQSRLKPRFDAAGVAYPPEFILLAGFKKESRLELYGGKAPHQLTHIWSYPILGASGTQGPKLREGDRQVPEGFYAIASLNPNSRFHLSLRVSYPNEFDRARAEVDGRNNLGGDIMIHGRTASIGCLAMGDEAAEDLFILAASVDLGRIEVLLSPVDFRESQPMPKQDSPEWVAALYEELSTRVKELPRPRG